MSDQLPSTGDTLDFTIRDVTECGKALRETGREAGSMEETAAGIVGYLYDHLLDKRTGMRACSLVRFFKTHAYKGLDDELRGFARNIMKDAPPSPDMKCLVLLATAGEKTEWNSRINSRGHRAIPLPSEEMIHQIPMIRNLINQLGLSVNTVIKPDPEILLDIEQKTYNVFHIPEAPGSPYIPAQEEFVIPSGIKSALGFGGLLPSGDMFVVIMFLKVPVSQEVAGLFKPLSLNAKIAILPFENAVFAKPPGG